MSLSQPIISKTKNNGLLAHIFPDLQLAAFALSSDCFIRLSVPVVIGQNDLLVFGFAPVEMETAFYKWRPILLLF